MSRKSKVFEDSPQDTYDSQKNKVLKSTFYYDKKEEKIAVADHVLVTPAYLVEVKENVQKFAQKVLYEIFMWHRFDKQTNNIPKLQRLSKNPTN